MRFTDKAVAALRPKATRYEVWAGNGFGLRITPHGVKTWVWVYRFKGRPRRMTLGTYPAVGLADAHLKLAGAQKLLERGVDPGEQEVAHKRAERLAETITELAEDYLEKWAKPRKRKAAEDERVLRKDVLPRWGTRKAKDITRKDVIALLDGIVLRGAPIQANRTFSIIRKMFSWAVSRDLVPVSPCAKVAAPSAENQRDRVLSTDEITSLWTGLADPELSMSPQIRLALKFQLATAQRKGEVIHAEWSDFDLESETVWTIPSERAKNGLAHRVPLSPLALSLLAEIKKANAPKPEKPKRVKVARQDLKNSAPEAVAPRESRWLFPSPHGDKPITGPAVDHAMRRSREDLGTGDATPHDLRRSAASHMTSIGITRLVVSKILNHAEAGVTKLYDRHSYDAEKRAALEAWGRRLTEITSGQRQPSNVIELARA